MTNEQNNDLVDVSQPSEGQIVLGLSWVGYLPILPVVTLYVVIIALTATLLKGMNFGLAIYAIYAFAFASIIYQVMLRMSVKLVINNNGVWVVRGVLPWKKTSLGLQWRNIAIASFRNSFFTWVFGSYTINLEDRFTGRIEMTVDNIKNGKFAVTEINRILAEKHSV
jgi:hypothetical protein